MKQIYVISDYIFNGMRNWTQRQSININIENFQISCWYKYQVHIM